MTAARPLLRAAVAGLALGGIAFAGAPAAVAAPGDNGDIAIHDTDTPPLDQRSESKVCRFYLAAFNFAGLQQVTYTITPQPLETGDPTLTGAINLAPTGTGQTTELTLPEGQYRLTWTFPGATVPGNLKVFRVDCPNGHGDKNKHGDKDKGKDTEKDKGEKQDYDGKGPHGGVGAGGGGTAAGPADETPAFGVGAALAAGLAGTAGVVLVRRRRRADGAA
ncbi:MULTISPECIES: hypothetical protein [Streptomyces]|uniref:Gram-positive cocci surface proteins LPxTG domain-containing protein n=2 Tax=Streptomyces TaxID=1883 RepID=A0A1D8FY60_9ACTN|nr:MULTISPECIES: hypothetical protein [Streptomyces]AOT58148.1 hypothetical protein A4G23_00952 [Streptomyces rubrolavendulae]KAF0646113.1 hypothetical protein K701_30465 [Streptomyces fradiae ATCC 10745 = DSM 40063]OSY48799.1 hypothetical protein BG846_05623 [Streptomyces fradiae ATCC 10745 = DSM 40063]QEV11471.1 hypothetical protein CP974_04945 [Streptomyces fradiae ATCC 10745 = DSM 40063]UQS28829.1 hypothetical protein J5J01_17540 [Streptomyces fradiae]